MKEKHTESTEMEMVATAPEASKDWLKSQRADLRDRIKFNRFNSQVIRLVLLAHNWWTWRLN